MPDTPNPIPPPKPSPTPASSPAGAGRVPMSEEFDRAKWTLPPIVPVLIAAAAIAIVVAVVALSTRAKPAAGGAGEEAGQVAGRIQQSGGMAMLVPRELGSAIMAASAPLPPVKPGPSLATYAFRPVGPPPAITTACPASRLSLLPFMKRLYGTTRLLPQAPRCALY